jgi:hypothetical protein
MGKKAAFKPYENEADCLQLGDLTVENRLDRISIFGSIDLWKDKAGLQSAREIKALIDEVVKTLEGMDLPEKVSLAKIETIENPFA